MCRIPVPTTLLVFFAQRPSPSSRRFHCIRDEFRSTDRGCGRRFVLGGRNGRGGRDGHGGRALFQVRPHVAALAEAQAALVARVRLDARVVVHVRFQVVLFRERLAAHGARVRLDARVQAHVQRHVGPVGERLVAHGARERLLARVYAQMLFEQHFARERLAAVVATVRLLARVYAHVHVVRHALVEALAAVLALVLLPVSVDFHVRAQVTAVVEQLTAFRAAARELPGALVHGPVVLVVAQLAELFAARLAHERFFARMRPLVDLKKNKINTNNEKRVTFRKNAPPRVTFRDAFVTNVLPHSWQT